MEDYDESNLPRRLFLTGQEPDSKGRINSYFNLRWLEDIKPALDEEDITLLNNSQFQRLLQMGNHTFSVTFVHYILCRQLVTNKENELWFVFGGKPIRYSIRDFALVTGLNCNHRNLRPSTVRNRRKGKSKVSGGSSDGEFWKQLFGKEKKITTSWIHQKLLLGKRYKDSQTRLRLVLLLLAYGFCCPTSHTTHIREEFVELVEDIDGFLAIPWGRKSFELTVNSAKPRDPSKLCQDTLVVQGFAHAFQLVMVVACPALVKNPLLSRTIQDEEGSVDAIAQCVAEINLMVSVDRARLHDKVGQVEVQSCIGDMSDTYGDQFDSEDDEDDPAVGFMVSLINDQFPFQINSWLGGVMASEINIQRVQRGERVPVDSDDEVEEVYPPPPTRTDYGNRSHRDQPNAPLQTGISSEQASASHIPFRDVEALLQKMNDSFLAQTSVLIESFSAAVTKEVTKAVKMLGEELKSEIGLFQRKNSSDSSRQPGQHHSSYQTEEEFFPGNDNFHTDIREPDGHSNHAPPPTVADGGLQFVEDLVNEINNDDPTENEVISLSDKEPFPNQTPQEASVGDMFLSAAANLETSCEEDNALVISCSQKSRSGEFIIQTPSFNLGVSQESFPNRRRPFNVLISPSSRSLFHTPSLIAPVLTPTFNLDVTQMFLPNQLSPPTHARVSPLLTSSLPNIQAQPTKAVKDKKAKQVPPKTRWSNRSITAPVRLSPVIHNLKRTAPKKQEEVLPPKPPKRARKQTIHALVGRFNPFICPKSEQSEAFVKKLSETPSFCIGSGIIVENTVFLRLFEGQHFLNASDMDLLITFTQRRRDNNVRHKFDFLPHSFFSELCRQYEAFTNSPDKEAFNFSSVTRLPLLVRPRWLSVVDTLYCPFSLDGVHWVGLVADLNAWTLTFLDCNQNQLSFLDVEASLIPIATLLLYLIRNHCDAPAASVKSQNPLAIQQLDVSLKVEEKGLVGVATLVLLEQHATGRPEECTLLTKDMLRFAAQNYAMETFRILKSLPNLP